MRTFLTLVPDATTALAIDKWCGLCWPALVRRIPVQNYHMTVAFLGDTDDTALETLAELQENFSHPSFDLQLDEVGFFADSGLLWLGSRTVPEQLDLLQKKCTQSANRIGCRGSTKNYRPHITLARKADSPAAALIDPDFGFTADRLELWSSVRASDGARYSTLASWPLV